MALSDLSSFPILNMIGASWSNIFSYTEDKAPIPELLWFLRPSNSNFEARYLFAFSFK